MKANANTYALAAVGAAQGLWKYYKPELVLGALVGSAVAYDLACKPGGTISEAVDGIIEKHPLTTRLAIGATALHLANLIPKPDTFDPIHIVFKKIKNI